MKEKGKHPGIAILLGSGSPMSKKMKEKDGDEDEKIDMEEGYMTAGEEAMGALRADDPKSFAEAIANICRMIKSEEDY